jgi:hypothetical protein
VVSSEKRGCERRMSIEEKINLIREKIKKNETRSPIKRNIWIEETKHAQGRKSKTKSN